MRSILLILFLHAFIIFSAHGQLINDNCSGAIELGFIENYCSGVSEFDNSMATNSPSPIPACWFDATNKDLWFEFNPKKPALYLKIVGNTMSSPAVALYRGGCGTLEEIACASQETGNLLELTVPSLIVGETYYLRVDARNDLVGSFQLCITTYFPIPTPESDCKDAVVLCDKSPFQIENLDNVGDLDDELTGSCVEGDHNLEKASVWYVWTCEESGSLTFTLDPNNPNSTEEDLDFVVYELPGGLSDCNNRVSLRCMLSGESGGQSATENSPCYGPTGLREGETDFQEFPGCDDGSNNFVAPIDMVAGHSYGLIVNNYSASSYGFSIEFGGTGTFLGPKADFEIISDGVLECDKILTFNNLSSSATDAIESYSWTFGSGADPIQAEGEGPHTSNYATFGDKLAVLTLETKRGCIVSKIKDFYVEPCCKDTSTLLALADANNIVCYGDDDGFIRAGAKSGSPVYKYSLDGINYQKYFLFNELAADDYTVYVIDSKGCEDSINVTIAPANPLTVDAGPDQELDLGYSTEILAELEASGKDYEIIWSPLDSFLTCEDCLNPEVIPPGTTTYTITVINEDGCEVSDEMTIYVVLNRPIYVPNVFSPNGDANNDFFNVFGNRAIKKIKELKVFDRWGELIYEGSPIHNVLNQGWDGTFKGRDVDPGVYTWMAQVEFIDLEVLIYTGSITVVR